MNATVPLWLTLVLTLGAAALGFVGNALTGLLDFKKSAKSDQITRENAQDAIAMAEKTLAFEISKNVRELVRAAVALRDGTPGGIAASERFLVGISKMKLSPDDYTLVHALIGPVSAPALDQARKVDQETGSARRFVLRHLTRKADDQ